jgi:PAS domain S-box-containing protein
VWTATPSGEIDSLNGRGLDYFGGSLAELAARPWHDLVHPDDRQASLERWWHSLRTGEEYEAVLRLRRADGVYRWHLGRAVALREPDGRIAKWFGTNTDMDELTRTRNELRARAEFDQQLIGIVSHDLRNPLNAIGMATALLLKYGQLSEQHVKIVTRIMSSSDRAVRLIRDFLDFTQTRVSGRIPVVRTEVNIREISRQVFEEVHLTQPHREGFIEHAGDETGMWDGDRLAQLVGNLVSNAFQHSSETGAVRLTTTGGPDEVVIDVHNEGPPIPPDALERLFEPFERGDDIRPHSGRSVGLGLYISRQIVEAHGGRIEVESSAARGTRFTVRLPRTAPDSPADDPERASAASTG